MALRISPLSGDKELVNRDSVTHHPKTIRNLFNSRNPERLYGIIGVLFNDKRTQILHPTEVVSISNSSFFRFVFTFLFTSNAVD